MNKKEATQFQPVNEPTNGADTQQGPSAEQIAVRAHQIFLERGGIEGHDVDDWLQAERELRTQAAGNNRSKPRAKRVTAIS